MIQARYKEFVKKIAKESGLDEEEIDKRIRQKQTYLGGLVTLEGAALIVANELGIRFDRQRAKVSELMTGMRNVGVVGKVVRLYPTRTYKQKSGLQGKLISLLLADDTASVRVVLWDVNHVNLFDNGELKQGDVVEIKGADVRGTDIKELHLSGKSSIASSDEEISEVNLSFGLSSSKLSTLNEGDRALVRATVVQMFSPTFFPACPQCRKRTAESSGKFFCTEHKEVVPVYTPVLSLYIDDGFANLRAVLFLDSVKKLFSLSDEDLVVMKDDPSSLEPLKEQVLGEEFFFEGRARKNALFNRLEFVVNNVNKVDVEALIEELSKGAKLV